jgi:class 3 adenylate cyclase/tetratricopeptide (TPR) repeat protein
MEGERRTVTVLFADTVGSTTMEELLDPELTFRIMQGAAGCMAEAVHRYEGFVTQFRGDGIMALFGAPIAHENAAHRAVAAALAMQRRLIEYAEGVEREHGAALGFRVGLNTGLVVVGAISDNLSMDYTAMGDTVNLAARMEQVAEPGTVYISENTYRAVHDYVDCEPLGAVAVKGKSEPVVAYRAVREKGIHSRLDVSAAHGLTQFVGRADELGRLRELTEQIQAGFGRVLFLSGEAGVGKSRLLLEFRRSLGDDVSWLEGRCLPKGEGTSEPIAEIVRGALGIGDCDDEATILARIEDGTEGWPEQSRATAPYLKYLLGVRSGEGTTGAVVPAERATRIREGLIALLVEESARKPMVVVIEDLHWVDELTNNMLLGLLRTVATVPVLMVLTHRPGTERAVGRKVSVIDAASVFHGDILDKATFFQRVDLGPLSEEESAAFATCALGPGLPDDLQKLIAKKAEGNPFFVEEVARSLIESGMVERAAGACVIRGSLEDLRIPDTVEEVILARIDSLKREPRETVQLASVIGREFARALLACIADPQARLDAALSVLEELEFIYETAFVPEVSYAFKHAITGEVAYSTLLHERRKALHRIVAISMEELYADRLPEHYGMLAHHYLEGEVWEKALQYLELAGDQSLALFANQPAVEFYSKALAVCERLGNPDLRRIASLLQKSVDAHFNLRHYQETLDDLARWRDVAVTLHDADMEGHILVNRGSCEGWHQTHDSAVTTLEEALAFAEEHDLAPVRLRALSILVLAYYDCQRMDDVRRTLDSAIELAETVQPIGASAITQTARGVTMVPPSAVAAMRLTLGLNGGSVLTWTGQFDRALALLDRYGDAIASLPNIFARLNAHFVSALALGGKGDYDGALAILNNAVTTCDRFGEHFFYARMLNTIGWIHGDLQDFDGAIYWNQRSLLSARGWNPAAPDVECNALANLADNFIALGRLEDAEDCLRQVAAMVEKRVAKDCMQLWRYTLHHYASFADLWLARGDSERALAAATECLVLADGTESAKYIVRARRARGLGFLAQGKLAEAEEEVSAALTLAVEVGNPPQLWRTHEALGELRRAEGRPDDARQAYENALEVIESVGARLKDTRLRESLLRSEHVKRISAATARTPA